MYAVSKATSNDPRFERTRRRVLEAAFHLIRQGGPAAVTYSALAEESGVGRATIYRHWPTLDELWPDVIAEASRQMPMEPSGDLRDDLITALGYLAERIASPEERLQFLAILEHAQVDRASTRLMRVAQQHNPVVMVLDSAVRSGALTPDLDLELATALLVGPILQRGLFLGKRPEPRFIETIVDRFLAHEERPVSRSPAPTEDP